jgi:hypothetical protein
LFESFFVFLPYFARGYFPKTSFRAGLKTIGNKTAGNASFYFVVTWVTKIFYIWAKHFIGFGLNYYRFLDKVSPENTRLVYNMLLWSAFATTISMFLHTLKFKGFIGPRTSYLIYMGSYLATFYAIARLGPMLIASPRLLALIAGGVAVNFGPWWATHVYQAGVLVLLNAVRGGYLDLAL